MLYYSTNRRTAPVTLREAVLRGQAEDGGLFMPVAIPQLSSGFLESIRSKSIAEIAMEVCLRFLGDEVPNDALHSIVGRLDFDAPLVTLEARVQVLELFHGPTLAFKDFGARFMAGLLSYFIRNEDRQLTVLVATSGDTGSAVANGFLGAQGIRVIVLYPSGKVSEIQEKQMTTLGDNITALEIEGNFDDCQRLVKQAFLDQHLNTELRLTSANSINIARLVPQTFYYFRAFAQINATDNLVFSVPSGNFGNLTAGIFAKRMGLPVSRFIAATNVNDVVPRYLLRGTFQPEPSRQTLSNAMDVGNPSNFARMLALYENNRDAMLADLCGSSHTDEETKQEIHEVYTKYRYVMDPHGAVASVALRNLQRDTNCNGIILETAHPAKFRETVESAAGISIDLPTSLQACLAKEKQSIRLTNNFEDFKAHLLSL